jgi:eukaryotic-like serine/threonine-protein kinase
MPAARCVPRRENWELLRISEENRWTRTFVARLAGYPPSARAADADFAIKVARPDLAAWHDRDLAQGLLRREALIGRTVDHPHVATTLAVERYAGGLRLLQPWRPTLPLRGFLTAQSLAVKLWIVRQTAEAIAGLHASGWLHGTITPAAIAVSRQGHATLGELGWGRKLHSDECNLAAMPFIGDARYAAPEAFDGQGRLTPAADIYALGVVAFEAISGMLPWLVDRPTSDAHALIAARRLLPAANLASVMPSVSFGLATLLAAMLERDPLRRPTAAEVACSLVAYEVASITRELSNC